MSPSHQNLIEILQDQNVCIHVDTCRHPIGSYHRPCHSQEVFVRNRPSLDIHTWAHGINGWNHGMRCLTKISWQSDWSAFLICSTRLSGWWYTYPSEKWSSSVGMMTFPIYGKIKNVPNHQPAILINYCGRNNPMNMCFIVTNRCRIFSIHSSTMHLCISIHNIYDAHWFSCFRMQWQTPFYIDLGTTW